MSRWVQLEPPDYIKQGVHQQATVWRSRRCEGKEAVIRLLETIGYRTDSRTEKAPWGRKLRRFRADGHETQMGGQGWPQRCKDSELRRTFQVGKQEKMTCLRSHQKSSCQETCLPYGPEDLSLSHPDHCLPIEREQEQNSMVPNLPKSHRMAKSGCERGEGQVIKLQLGVLALFLPQGPLRWISGPEAKESLAPTVPS